MEKQQDVKESASSSGEFANDSHPVEFKSTAGKKIFDSLVDAFIEDYMVKKFVAEKSGWRTLVELSAKSHLSTSVLYGKHSTLGPALDEPVRRGLVETRIFPGERGRGGQVLRLRICYEKEPVKAFVNSKVMGGKQAVLQPPNTELRRLSRTRIAVLPFVNISPDSADAYFADGMTEELLDKLAQIKALKVIARTTMMQFKNAAKRASDIGRELESGTVVEGSVRKAGNRIRITAQLIDANSDEHLWSSSYDRDYEDVFAIQSDIALKVASSISESLSIGIALPEKKVHRESEDLQAYTLFLRARQLSRERKSEETVREAARLFEDAIKRDPSFSKAYVGLAGCINWLATQGVDPYLESSEKAKRLLSKALELNPKLAEAHSLLSYILLSDDKLEEAEAEAKMAIELNSNLAEPYTILAQLAAGAGRIAETVKLLESAERIDPLEPNTVAFLARSYLYAGDEKKAIEYSERILPIVPYRANCYFTEYYLSRSLLDKAQGAIQKLWEIRPTDPWTWMFEGYLAALRGDRDRANLVIRDLERSEKKGMLTVFLRGFLHLALGEKELFYDCMKRAKEMHQLPKIELMYSPLFKSIRAEKEYARLIDAQTT